MNVHRILAEPLIIHGIRKAQREERIREVLEEVKLVPIADFMTKYPHMLSGGQQQRVVIARAILLRPKLIVADEPVSMLDASVRVEILELLRNLQSAHRLAVIYITHDLSAVRHFSERIFVMYGGQDRGEGEGGRSPAQPAPPPIRGRCCGPSRTRTPPTPRRSAKSRQASRRVCSIRPRGAAFTPAVLW